ncbi:PAAR domain-containing protein, partial [Pseudomonas syringae group genomosp. 3]
MFEAARLHDGIEHTGALGGLLAGAVIGIAMAVAGAALIVCTAGLGAILLGVVLSIGAGAAPAMGESWGAARTTPAGDIMQTGCSPNVFINGRNAALATQTTAKCENHPAPILIADGSTNVFINGHPAARKGDKVTCGAKIGTGSNNVFIGGGTKRYLKV